MVMIQEQVADALSLPDALWQGKRVAICGQHLGEVLAAILSVPDE